MKIEDRFNRYSDEDVFFLEAEIKKVQKGKFWDVLRCVTSGRRVDVIRRSGDKLSPDRILGRIEALEMLISDLEQILVDAENLRRPQDMKYEKPTEIAQESVDFGGIVA